MVYYPRWKRVLKRCVTIPLLGVQATPHRSHLPYMATTFLIWQPPNPAPRRPGDAPSTSHHAPTCHVYYGSMLGSMSPGCLRTLTAFFLSQLLLLSCVIVMLYAAWIRISASDHSQARVAVRCATCQL